MKNVHPIYNIKALMIKRELAKNPALKDEDWERFLPKYKSKTLSKRKKPKVVRKKKDYTPFPPAQPESKIDKQLASGEYFMNERERKLAKLKEKSASKVEAAKKQMERRAAPFQPPAEEPAADRARRVNKDSGTVNIGQLKAKLRKTKTLPTNLKSSV